MKETGKLLDLSSRTIEFYLNNIKQKTGLNSRDEILVNFIKDNKVYNPHI
jgi:DNA-binding CsgD family transcriptional regulator